MSMFLHAAFGQGRLWLWGETAVDRAAPLPKPRRRKSGPPLPLRNPFDAGAEAQDDAAEVLGLASAGVNLDRAVL